MSVSVKELWICLVSMEFEFVRWLEADFFCGIELHKFSLVPNLGPYDLSAGDQALTSRDFDEVRVAAISDPCRPYVLAVCFG